MLSQPILFFSLILFGHQLVLSHLLHSLPDDLYAFPKYRITFLNGLPLLNETAERWLREGLRGGEAEFFDHPTPWHDRFPFKHIDAGEGTNQAVIEYIPDYTIELMKMGPRDTYICFIPPSSKQGSPHPEETITEVTASRSWLLLQPLDGTCLYHRQGWFTYAYCHNSHVRQFREMIRPRPVTPGKAYEIEEDPDWEAYDLGRAPNSGTGADLSRADHDALAANLELARGAGSRYLVQRWGDGSICDRTGKRREIEVQFHCSMTMTDSIMFVKETKTCHYVLVINTPRLCGEPGFKSRIDQRDEALIRCRQVVDATTLANLDSTLPEADHPLRQRRAPVTSPPPPIDAAEAPSGGTDGGDASHEPLAKGTSALDHQDLLRRALEAILHKTGNPPVDGSGAGTTPRVVVEDVGDGEVMIEFISEVELNDEADLEQLIDSKTFEDALRAAGFDVRDQEVEVEVEAEREEGRRAGGHVMPKVAGKGMRTPIRTSYKGL
ncbi:hypothetical protein B0F90DRAFT_1690540 [Multifurca ochricompacta]|uniref:Protein OS-9 homolog n=1 Tax=Multifurca ochricompacta TaxID=376703 RepID=A0AAD4MAY1_9AGAM|nr:hypothetical protein B0F90DRAFT_1690540 [Multifurca ochricompacta]